MRCDVPGELVGHEVGRQLLTGQVTWRQLIAHLPKDTRGMSGHRVVGGLRLSDYDGPEEDPSTSPVRQRLIIEKWAEQEGNTVVGWAEDLDVSASKVGPFARPALGDWLTYRTSEYDVLAFWRLDRAVRSMSDVSDLTRWAKDNGKDLVFIVGPGGDPFVLNMRSGLVAEFIAMAFTFAAQMESLAAMERSAEARAYMRNIGRYSGGWTSFPYHPVPLHKEKGWTLAPDREYVPWALFMVDKILNGYGPSAVADMLNENKVPTSKDIMRIRKGKEPKGHKWTYVAVIQVLRSRALCGITEIFPDWRRQRSFYRGDEREVVRRDDGQPIRFGEPVIDDATWRRVQDKLDALRVPAKQPRRDSPWLVGITYCRCGMGLHANRQNVKGTLYEYMRCTSHSGGNKVYARACNYRRNMPMIQIETAIDTWMAEHGTMAYYELHTTDGTNHEAEIAEVTNAIKDMAAKVALADEDDDMEREQRLLASLKARRKMLMAMPNEPDRLIYARTAHTVAQHWARLSPAEKHLLARARGAKFTVLLNGKDAEPIRGQRISGVDIECEPGTLFQGALAQVDQGRPAP